MPAIGALQTDLYADQGSHLPFTSLNQRAQARIYVNNLFNYKVNWTRYLSVGHYGWLKIRPTGEGAISGAVLYFNRNPSTGAVSPAPGSYNLRQVTSTQATLQTISGPLLFGY
jgi:hypothetical protein